MGSVNDEEAMDRAVELAATVRTTTSPNPWVGCVVISGAEVFEGATQPPGGPHAEVVALGAAGPRARGATLVSTLEPCAHRARTGPCVDAVIAAGVKRVVVAVEDPDPRVAGKGLARLRAAGIEVVLGVRSDVVSEQLAPYLAHRLTGRPWVVLKLAATLDGRIAAPDGTSRWITGAQARTDVQRLRAESDAILVGAGTVRADNPALTVHPPASSSEALVVDVPMGHKPLAGDPKAPLRQPLRVVLGHIPLGARVRPALEMGGDLGDVLDELGRRQILQVLVEGGATVASAFHAAGLVDRYVLYLAPALMGGDDGRPMFAGPGAATMDTCWRGRLVAVKRLGDDLRVELAPHGSLGR
jgi:diaminohydroxyphosphoribosylaminopyrimidine deaminase/5-amino-6-(5-phosphoribosylamino)uracil reductase